MTVLLRAAMICVDLRTVLVLEVTVAVLGDGNLCGVISYSEVRFTACTVCVVSLTPFGRSAVISMICI